ncbi:MAG: flagellar protein FlaG [Thermodesulfobacteriota bacterium]
MNVQAISDVAVRGVPGRAPPAELQPLRPAGGGESAVAHKAAPVPEPSREAVAQAVDGVNAFLASSNSHVQFQIHEASQRMMVEVIDDTTREVVKTIPSKELLDLAAKIGELVGTLLDRRG